MMISTKGRYALRVMLDLADQTKGSYIPLKDIAHRQEISVKYLENILASLSRAGLVEAIRGKGGGLSGRGDHSPGRGRGHGFRVLPEGGEAGL